MSNSKDLSVMIDDVKLNIRVGALIKYEDKILVEKNNAVDFLVIPGGRIKTLENSKQSLLREFREELGIDLSNEEFKMISFVENFFQFNGIKYHELYFVYRVDLEKNYGLKDGMVNLDNQDSKYYFLSLEEFKCEKVLPGILKKIVLNNEFSHYIVDDLK